MSRIRQTGTIRTAFACVVFALAAFGCGRQVVQTPSYLFVWAGAADRESSDFLGVIDATADSPAYGSIVASVPIGEARTFPHHTEQEMPGNGHLLANGFGAGRTWLFDLTEPKAPKVLTSFGAKAGFSHPHSFVRLARLGLGEHRAGRGRPRSCRARRGGLSPDPRIQRRGGARRRAGDSHRVRGLERLRGNRSELPQAHDSPTASTEVAA